MLRWQGQGQSFRRNPTLDVDLLAHFSAYVMSRRATTNRPLFPKLRDFELDCFTWPRWCALSCIPYLAGEALRSITFNRKSLPFAGEDEITVPLCPLHEVFALVKQHSPFLEHLGIWQTAALPMQDHSEKLFGEQTYGWASLKSFHTNFDLHQEDIDHLPNLPALASLAVSAWNFPCRLIPKDHILPSAGFQELRLGTLPLGAITDLLRAIPLPRLRVLTLQLNPWTTVEQEAGLVRDCFVAVAEITALEHLAIYMESAPERRGPMHFSASDLERLLPLHNLRTFRIASHRGYRRYGTDFEVDVGDATVIAMARAWPQLEILQLATTARSSSSDRAPTTVTPRALAVLRQSCPNLQSLSLTFDFSNGVSPATMDWIHELASGRADHALIQLEAGRYSWRSATISEALVRALYVLFPRLKDIRYAAGPEGLI